MDDETRLAFRFDLGATWLNLLATNGRTFGAHPVERIATAERLAAWLAECGLAPGTAPGAQDVDLVQGVREMLRPVAMAVAEGEPPPAEAVAALQAFLDTEPDAVRLIGTERLERSAPATTAAALARVLRQAVDHLTGPERADLAVCAERDCRAVFADPGGRRRWCSSRTCASRGRVRALRERRRAGQSEIEGE